LRNLAAVAIASGWLLAASAVHAKVPVFELRAECPDGPRVGNGFVVADPENPAKKLLVTAAHVLWGCTSAAMHEVNCAYSTTDLVWGLKKGTAVRYDPGRDLASVALPERVGRQVGEPGRMVIGARPPKTRSQVGIRGSSVASVCTEGFGFVIGQTRVRTLADHLERRHDMARKKAARTFAGSLDPEAAVLQYWGTATAGTSGAPVTPPGKEDDVIGIHQGGLRGESVGWAVLFGAGKTYRAALGDWPTEGPGVFVRPRLSQSADATVDKRVLEEARRWKPSQKLFSVELRVQGPGGWQITGEPFMEPRIGLSSEWYEFPAGTRSMSIAGRVVLGHISGAVTQRMEDPRGRPLEQETVQASAVFVEAGPELRMRRTSRVRPSLFAGVRAGVGAVGTTVAGMSDLDWSTSGWILEARVAVTPLSGYHALGLALGLRGMDAPGTHFRYTGAGANFEQRPVRDITALSFGLVYEY